MEKLEQVHWKSWNKYIGKAGTSNMEFLICLACICIIVAYWPIVLGLGIICLLAIAALLCVGLIVAAGIYLYNNPDVATLLIMGSLVVFFVLGIFLIVAQYFLEAGGKSTKWKTSKQKSKPKDIVPSPEDKRQRYINTQDAHSWTVDDWNYYMSIRDPEQYIEKSYEYYEDYD